MRRLRPDECRVLGTLVEKALTTPAQYPLSLNALLSGVNQRSNRDPVVEFDEERLLRAVDGLRGSGLLRDVHLSGSRVEKFKHALGDELSLRAPEQSLLAELLLRGPQTAGELRARAGRMHPFESIEVVEAVLESLAEREEPAVRRLPPLPGTRAPRWMQLFCESLHPIAAETGAPPNGGGVAAAGGSSRGLPEPSPRSPAQSTESLEARVAQLEERIAELERRLARSPGESPA